jgi:hypothetical protein
LSDLVPTARGTRVSALVYDAGTVLTPGLVLDLRPTKRADRLTLRVLVRRRSGEFHIEEYLVSASASAAHIRHDYVGVPGDELRQTWNGLALWDLLEIEADLRGPQGGDAVCLTTPWQGASTGDIGVLDGVVGQTPPREQGRITFNATTFRGPTRRGRILVQASGGPASISTSLRELGKTGRTVTLTVWRWQHSGPGLGLGLDEGYTVAVPVWEWTPGAWS